MNAIHFMGIHIMWVIGASAFVLLTFGLTVMVFRNNRNVEPGPPSGRAADPVQVRLENPPDPER
jgi:hypothetical protein